MNICRTGLPMDDSLLLVKCVKKTTVVNVIVHNDGRSLTLLCVVLVVSYYRVLSNTRFLPVSSIGGS